MTTMNPAEVIHSRYVHNRRTTRLSRHFSELLGEQATVLDVGCGDGLLDRLLMQAKPQLSIEGVEYAPRAECLIPVKGFDGVSLPYHDESFDYVMFVDVLHHTDDPNVLLKEARRVARRGILLKDHTMNGAFAYSTLAFMDEISNRRHGVVLPYNYWSEQEWLRSFSDLGLRIAQWRNRLGLYPAPADWIFGRDLHFICLLEKCQKIPLQRWTQAQVCEDPQWEQAYREFESPAQEIRKFRNRLLAHGAAEWSRDSAVVELFCGRGNGLVALRQLGFKNLSGVDLSAALLEQFLGHASLFVGDCRDLKFEDNSVDIVIIQGGLHHLPELPADLEQTLREVRRILRPGGRLLVVEPWLTPFLSWVHWATTLPPLRWLYPRLDALARMIERERTTYENWLSRPREILTLFERYFDIEQRSERWGKLNLLARCPR